jgi:hypothetical protein
MAIVALVKEVIRLVKDVINGKAIVSAERVPDRT